jgi:hypothetical protein
MEKTEYIYLESRISKSIVDDKWETDEFGNPIVIIEASNENLDYDGERVQRSALMDSKEYFLENGVISYDHKHIPCASNFEWDPEWNAEKYVLGRPLETWEGKNENGITTVFVKAVLSRSNEIAQQIISKLKDNIGTVKASVGGRKVKKAMKMDSNTYRDIPTITGVNWDEVALTHKPVNQTLGSAVLSPREFVKSLTAGSSADPGSMEGGNTLQVQSLESSSIRSLFQKMRNGEITEDEDAITHLLKSGYSEEKAGSILKVMINKYLGDVVMSDELNANDLIDTSTDELEKALKDLEGGGLSKARKDGTYVTKGGYDYMKKADGGYEKMDEDAPDYNGEDDDDGDEVEKSIGTIDVTDDIEGMRKSISTQSKQIGSLVNMVENMGSLLEKQTTLTKAIGNRVVEDSTMLKSIAGTPLPRATEVTNLNMKPRFEKAQTDKLVGMTEKTMVKSLMDKVPNAVISQASLVMRRKGMVGLAQEMPEVVKHLVKE